MIAVPRAFVDRAIAACQLHAVNGFSLDLATERPHIAHAGFFGCSEFGYRHRGDRPSGSLGITGNCREQRPDFARRGLAGAAHQRQIGNAFAGQDWTNCHALGKLLAVDYDRLAGRRGAGRRAQGKLAVTDRQVHSLRGTGQQCKNQ